MKQTATEWLFQQLWETPIDKLTWYAILKQATAMEKEQIKEAYTEGAFEKMRHLDGKDYRIIIPKEEPMSYEEFRVNASEGLLEQFDADCLKYSEDGNSDNHFYANCKYWENQLKEELKQERSYSEEEVIKIVEKSRETGLTAKFLLLTEQFKKK